MHTLTSKSQRRLLAYFRNRTGDPTRITDALGGDFSKHERRVLGRLGTLLHFEAGSDLIVEGQIGREAFVLASGKAKVIRQGDLVAEISAGAVFGETALIALRPRNATVTASSPLSVFVLNPAELSSLMMSCPRLGHGIRDMAKQHRAGREHAARLHGAASAASISSQS